MDVKDKRVFVGLSGGVDSAVAAALLTRAGAQVTGVFIKGWYPPGLPCTWAAERRDAMRIAAHLQIPFATLDASEEYKRGVIDYLLAEYQAGRTPNPDVMCNREVKFGAFYRYAVAAGADSIVTGHYARRQLGKSDFHNTPLFRGVDAAKDQSYFLWAVPREALAKTLFPLGELEKSEVRALAKRFDLPVAEKPDSQGICFLGPVSIDGFLRAEFGEAPGLARDEEGREVGRHDGAVLYTLGERVALHDALPGPWYVLAKDIAKNEVTVSHEHAPRRLAARASVPFRDANWLSKPTGLLDAQCRYRGPLVAGRILDIRCPTSDVGHRMSYIFEAAEALFPEIPAPGQSIVFYRGEELLGGGILE